VALAAALAYSRDGGAPWLLAAAGIFAAACKVTNLFAVGTVSVAFLVGAIAARSSGEAWTATGRRWMRDGGVLLAAGAATALLWVVVHNAIALVSLKDDPALAGLRGGSQSFGPVLTVATTFFQPLTDLGLLGSGTLGEPAQKPLQSLLAFVLIGGALAGLFVTPRLWNHVLGLLSIPALYLGGLVLGVGFMVGFGTNAGAGVSSRYALSLVPLMLLSLAASLRGRWVVGAVGALGASLFLVTFVVLVT
jgi:hypothetical protein